MSYKCKICSNEHSNQAVVAREMMFGFRDEFLYFKCSARGCLQIAEPPEDMAKYYPSDGYYSYRAPAESAGWKTYIKRIPFVFLRLHLLPLWIQRIPRLHWLRELRPLKKSAAILDVGYGAGVLLQTMAAWGYRNLTGVEPFIGGDIEYASGVRIYKSDIFAFTTPLADNGFRWMRRAIAHCAHRLRHQIFNKWGWLFDHQRRHSR